MKIAKRGNWTDAQVQEAITALKQEPGLWEALEHVEETTADFTFEADETAHQLHRREMQVMRKLHPDPSLTPSEFTDLYSAVRTRRRQALGLR